MIRYILMLPATVLLVFMTSGCNPEDGPEPAVQATDPSPAAVASATPLPAAAEPEVAAPAAADGIRQNGVIEVYGHTMQPFRVTIANGQPVSVDGSAAGRVSGFSVSETSMTFTVKADTGSWGPFPTTFNLDLANGGGEYLIGGRCGSNCSGTPRHKWLG